MSQSPDAHFRNGLPQSTHIRIWLIAGLPVLLLLALGTVMPARIHTATPSETPPQVRLSPRAQEEIKQVEAHIDIIEAAALAEMNASPDHARRIALLPETGFGAPVSELNRTTVSYPGQNAHASFLLTERFLSKRRSSPIAVLRTELSSRSRRR
jgi:hypothetical protein